MVVGRCEASELVVGVGCGRWERGLGTGDRKIYHCTADNHQPHAPTPTHNSKLQLMIQRGRIREPRVADGHTNGRSFAYPCTAACTSVDFPHPRGPVTTKYVDPLEFST